MNYHHAYHTGHSADIFKHFTLYLLLQALTKKDKPLSYIETHSGYAYYDLKSELPQTTQAYQEGISLLWQANPQGELGNFLQLIKTLNPKHELRYYPGSAWFAHHVLRPDDVMFLADINAEANQSLKAELISLPKIHVANKDGYSLLSSWLPPKPARGLVLIDPPYEKNDDWQRAVQACVMGLKRWAHGTYIIWYPIKNNAIVKQFYQNISALDFKEKIAIEFSPLANDVGQRLNGTGMLIINPPWQFQETITPLLDELLSILQQGNKGEWQIKIL